MSRLLDDDEITRQLTDLPGWRRAGHAITARYASPGFAGAVRLVGEVALVAEDMDHHPDIDIRFAETVWTLWTHVEGGVTQLDIELAHRIRESAATGGAHVREE